MTKNERNALLQQDLENHEAEAKNLVEKVTAAGIDLSPTVDDNPADALIKALIRGDATRGQMLIASKLIVHATSVMGQLSPMKPGDIGLVACVGTAEYAVMDLPQQMKGMVKVMKAGKFGAPLDEKDLFDSSQGLSSMDFDPFDDEETCSDTFHNHPKRKPPISH